LKAVLLQSLQPVGKQRSSWLFWLSPALGTTFYQRKLAMAAYLLVGVDGKLCAGRTYTVAATISSNVCTHCNEEARGTNDLSSPVLFKKIGITVKFVPGDAKAEDYVKYIDDKTKAIFIESIGNPRYHVADIPNLAKVSHFLEY
jgi:cystathionine beta-lyase/cystathionine gamma-synthase